MLIQIIDGSLRPSCHHILKAKHCRRIQIAKHFHVSFRNFSNTEKTLVSRHRGSYLVTMGFFLTGPMLRLL